MYLSLSLSLSRLFMPQQYVKHFFSLREKKRRWRKNSVFTMKILVTRSQAVAITMNRWAISATRWSKSGAIRARFSFAKSQDGNMCITLVTWKWKEKKLLKLVNMNIIIIEDIFNYFSERILIHSRNSLYFFKFRLNSSKKKLQLFF